jgi:hypothetical protein
MKAYDGLSEYYCEKLYPRYALYERNLRYMVLLMVTKAYGSIWVKKTLNVTDEESVLERTRKKKITEVSMDSILEYFELKQLENYLFVPPVVDMTRFVNEELTPQKLEQIGKEELCELIEQAKNPTCLWERIFCDIGNMNDWKTAMKSVHDVRNRVAHHRTITSQEYKETLKDIKYINEMIENSVDSIIANEIDEPKMIDILNSFAALAGKVLIKTFDFSSVKEMIVSFSDRMKELVKPIECNFQQSTIDAIRENALRLSSIDITEEYNETIQKLSNSWMLYDRQISNSIDEVGRSWKQYQIDAIGISTKFENIATQLESINTINYNKNNSDL